MGNKPNWGEAASTLGSGLLDMAEQRRQERLLKARRDQELADIKLRHELQLDELKRAAQLREQGETQRFERMYPKQVVGFEPVAGELMGRPIMEPREIGYTDDMNFRNWQKSQAEREQARADRGMAVQEANSRSSAADRAADNARLAAERDAQSASWRSGVGREILNQGGGDPRAQQPQLRDPDGVGPLPPTWMTPPPAPATEYQIGNETGLLGQTILEVAQDPKFQGMPEVAVAAEVYRRMAEYDPAVVEALGGIMGGYVPGQGFPGEAQEQGRNLGPLNFLPGFAKDFIAPPTSAAGPPVPLAQKIASDPAFAQSIRDLNKDGKYTMAALRAGLAKFARDFQLPLPDVRAAASILFSQGGTPVALPGTTAGPSAEDIANDPEL